MTGLQGVPANPRPFPDVLHVFIRVVETLIFKGGVRNFHFIDMINNWCFRVGKVRFYTGSQYVTAMRAMWTRQTGQMLFGFLMKINFNVE